MQSVHVENLVPNATIWKVAISGRMEPNVICLNADLEFPLSNRSVSI